MVHIKSTGNKLLAGCSEKRIFNLLLGTMLSGPSPMENSVKDSQ